MEFWAAVLLVTWGSDDMDLARLPGTRPQLRRDLRHILTAHPQAESRASCVNAQRSALTCNFAGQYTVSNGILTMETLCRLS